MSAAAARTRPNILITGTPGTGKTTTSELLAQETGLTHINFGKHIIEGGFHDGYNAEFDTHDVTETNLGEACDAIESTMQKGGVILDYASCDYFPERWFDLVVVLRTTTDVLGPRLQARDYGQNKVMENIQAEIFQVVLDDATELYSSLRVLTLQSDTVENMTANVSTLEDFIAEFVNNGGSR